MVKTISQKEVAALPFIEIAPFSPDYDERADFVVFMPNGEEYRAAKTFDGDLHHYIFDKDMPANLRGAALEAVDILLDEHFAEESRFTEDEEDPNVIYIAVHQMCQNFGLYTNCGREILSMIEA